MTRMKESGIDWIGQIPEEWEVAKVNHIFEEHKQKNRGNKEKNLLSLSYGRIIRKSIDSSFGLLPESFDTYNIIQRGDIVLRLTDLQNDKRSLRVGLARENGIITSAYLTLRLKNLESNDSYMYYLLHTYDICKVFYNFGGGVRQGGTWSDIYKMELLIPPCNEQQKIADYLDKKIAQLDRAKRLLEKQIQKLKDYRASLIYETVTKGLDKTVPMKDSGIDWIGQVPQGWGVSKLKFILEKGINSIKVGPFGSSLSGDAIRSSGKWVYNQRNVLDNNFTETDFYISEAKCKELKNFSVSSGDILLTTRGTIGRVAIVPKKYCEGIIHPCLMKFKVDSKIVLPELIKYLFNDIPLVREQLNFLSNSTTIDVIYSYNLKNIIIPIIPIEEQYSTLEVLDRQTSDVDSLIKIKQKHIENINKQRQTLIYDYVTGKRRV